MSGSINEIKYPGGAAGTPGSMNTAIAIAAACSMFYAELIKSDSSGRQ
jgi:hypothetical protein